MPQRGRKQKSRRQNAGPRVLHDTCCLLCPCKSCKNVCAGGQRARKERKRELVGAPGRKETNAAKSSTRHLLPVASMQILNPVCLKLSDQCKLNQRTSVHSLEAAQQRALHRVWSALPVPSMQILHQWLAGAAVHRGRGLHPSIAGAWCSFRSRASFAVRPACSNRTPMRRTNRKVICHAAPRPVRHT